MGEPFTRKNVDKLSSEYLAAMDESANTILQGYKGSSATFKNIRSSLLSTVEGTHDSISGYNNDLGEVEKTFNSSMWKGLDELEDWLDELTNYIHDPSSQ